MAGYIKFDGIDGESVDKDHKGWINILSFGQGIHQPGGGATGTARRRGDVILDDIHVAKLLDKSSPKIAESVCLGKVYPESRDRANRLVHRRRSRDLLPLRAEERAGYQLHVSGAAQSEDVPAEDFSLNFEEIKVTYTENDSKGKKKGNVEYGWKVEEGEKA